MSAPEQAKFFPIQGEHGERGKRLPYWKIPWGVAEAAYEDYSRRYGRSQSIERLAERGGFSWMELAQHLMGWHFRQKGPGWLSELARSLGYDLVERKESDRSGS